MQLTGDWAEADDLVQEAFTAALTAWSTVGSYPRSQQLAWLNRVMINKKVDRWRKIVVADWKLCSDIYVEGS
jgi:DNA-directed RNA polymerase specialized sigma24 family protein